MHTLSIMARSLFLSLYVQFMDATLRMSVVNGKNLIPLRSTVVDTSILMVCPLFTRKT